MPKLLNTRRVQLKGNPTVSRDMLIENCTEFKYNHMGSIHELCFKTTD